MRRTLAIATTAALLTAVPGARADVIFTLGNNPQTDEHQILFGAKESGNPITGQIAASNPNCC